MLRTWFIAVPKVVTRAESAFPANLQKLRRGKKWLYLHDGIQWTSVQLYMLGRGKQVLPYFCIGKAVVTQYFQKSWSKDAPFCRAHWEVICHCSARDGNTCLLETELYLRSSWPRTKGMWQLRYLKFNQWPKGEAHFYDVTLNLDGCSRLSVSTVTVSCFFCYITQEEE